VPRSHRNRSIGLSSAIIAPTVPWLPESSDGDVGDATLGEFFLSYFWQDGELDAQGRVPHAI
jgi:hypothetical protein